MHSVTESRTLPCSGSTSARFMPGMSRNESRWRALLRDKGAAETPWAKEYVRAPIAEADLEGKFRTHEGVVTRDFGKEMEVVNPLPTWAGLGKAPWTKYVTKRCYKESATEVPIPLTKAKGVEEIRGRLDTRVWSALEQKNGKDQFQGRWQLAILLIKTGTADAIGCTEQVIIVPVSISTVKSGLKP